MDKFTEEKITNSGISLSGLKKRPDTPDAYTEAGLPSLIKYSLPTLDRTNANGFVVSSNALKDIDKNRGATQAMFLRPAASKNTIAHETEHLLARQNLGMSVGVNDKFDELIKDPSGQRREEFVLTAMKMSPYLKEKYGLDSVYFNTALLARNAPEVVFYEQLASLAGAEAAQNVDLTKDPILRETLFKDPAVRETYNAMSGLRQTRLDPRDLPPYTRVPEKAPPVPPSAPSAFDRVKNALKGIF